MADSVEIRIQRVREKLVGFVDEQMQSQICPDNVALVEALLIELERSSLQARGLKERLNAKSDECARLAADVDPLRHEIERVVRENNSMHLQIIREAEDHKEAVRRLELQTKQLQDESHDVRFVATQYQARLDALESANSGIRQRMDAVLDGATGEEITLPQGMGQSGDVEEGVSRIPAPRRISSSAATGLQTRVEELQRRVAALQDEKGRLADQVLSTEGKVAARDVEIERLSSEMARWTGTETARLRYKCTQQETQILELRQQLDYLYTQLADFEGDLLGKDEMNKKLKELKDANDALRRELRDEMLKSDKLCDELKAVKRLVQQLKRQIKATQEMRGPREAEETQEVVLHERIAALESERDTLKGRLSETPDDPAVLRQRIAAVELERDVLKERLSGSSGDAGRLQREAHTLAADAAAASEALAALRSDHQEDEATIAGLREELAGIHAAFQRQSDDTKLLADRCAALEQENERLSRRGVTRKASSDPPLGAGVPRVPPRRVLKALEEERDSLRSELAVVSGMLKQSRQRVAALEERLASLGVESSRQSAELASRREAHTALLNEIAVRDEGEVGLRGENAALTRRLEHLADVQGQCDELATQTQLQSAELARAALATERADRELATMRARALQAEEERAASDDALAAAQKERGVLQATIARCEQETDALQRHAGELGEDRDTVVDRLVAAQSDLARLRSAELEARSATHSEAEHARHAAGEVERLRRETESARHEAETAREARDAARRELSALRNQGSAAMDSVAHLKLDLGAARQECAKLHGVVAGLGDELQEAKQALVAATGERDGLRQEVSDRETQLGQLRRLIEDVTRSRDAESSRTTDLESELAEHRRMAREAAAYMQAAGDREAELRSAVRGLEETARQMHTERDSLMNELDAKAEREAEIVGEQRERAEEMERVGSALRSATEQLEAEMEERNTLNKHIAACERTIAQLRGEMERLRGDLARKTAEVSELASDLDNMTQENQMVNRDLATTAAERDAYANELQQYMARVVYVEEMVKAKEREKAELLNSFRTVGDEHSRMSAYIDGAAQEKARLTADLQDQLTESQALRQRVTETEAQSARFQADLVALGQHAADLSRSLAMVGGDLDATRHRASHLESQLDATREVIAEAEGTRGDHAMRQMEVETQFREMSGDYAAAVGRANDLEEEVQALRAHVGQLEALLLEERARGSMAQEREVHGESVVSASHAAVRRMQDDVGALQGRAARLEAHLAEASAARGELVEETSRLRRELESARSRVRVLSATEETREVEQLKAFITRYERELGAAERRLAESQAANEGKDAQLAELEVELAGKNEMIADLRRELGDALSGGGSYSASPPSSRMEEDDESV